MEQSLQSLEEHLYAASCRWRCLRNRFARDYYPWGHCRYGRAGLQTLLMDFTQSCFLTEPRGSLSVSLNYGEVRVRRFVVGREADGGVGRIPCFVPAA